MRPLQTVILEPTLSNTDLVSNMIDMRQMEYFSVQVNLSIGSCLGNVQIQVTNDPCLTTFGNYTPEHWADLGTPIRINQASGIDSIIKPSIRSAYMAARVKFIDLSSGVNTSQISLTFSGRGN